jgi:galactokinase
MILKDKISAIFNEKFGRSATLFVFAPGRANIIGEHTDYNDGFVLPFAIGQGIWFAADYNNSGSIRIWADDFSEEAIFEFNGACNQNYNWCNYVKQILALLDIQNNQGLDIVIGSNMPIGGGVSSSSALTCGCIELLTDAYQMELTPRQKLEYAIRAEHGTGVIGGIMDQFTIINGKAKHAILLDCQTQSATHIPIEMGDHCFYLINTMVKHNLVETDYNLRRRECEHAVATLQKNGLDIKSLRDLKLTDIPFLKSSLDETLFKRAVHVLTENIRVLSTVECLKSGNYTQIGELLLASHDSLSNDYKVSCPELDWQVEFAQQYDHILGGRMMGGGFGGCTIHLATHSLDKEFEIEMKTKYKETFGLENTFVEVKPFNGILHNKN